MEAVLGWLILLVGLLVSVALHELGHMLPAKRFGVKVSEYFVGFGRTVWSVKRGETEYGIKALPLGGFVRLVGMVPPAEQVKPVRLRGWARDVIDDARAASVAEIGDDDSRAFYHLTWWRKVIVMAGGPVVNLIIAIVLFTVVTSAIGVSQQTLTIDQTMPCIPTREDNTCVASDPASPAALAGLQAGDTFVSIDGVTFDEWQDLTAYVAARPGQKLAVVVEREGSEVAVNLVPGERERPSTSDPEVTETVGFMGVYSRTEKVRQPITTGATTTFDAVGQSAGVIARLPVELYHVTRAALGMEERSETSVMGLIGIGRTAGDVASYESPRYTMLDRVSDMISLLAGLNLALFVFNMIPLTPLDGGHIASALWQAIKNAWAKVRKLPRPHPVDVARQMPVAYVVFGILILMSVVLAIADLVAPVRLA